MYFDEITGGALAPAAAKVMRNKNSYAYSRYHEGTKLLEQGVFKRAYEAFLDAYDGCCETYKERSQFEQSLINTKNKWAEEMNELGRSWKTENKMSIEEMFEKLTKIMEELKESASQFTTNIININVFLQKIIIVTNDENIRRRGETQDVKDDENRGNVQPMIEYQNEREAQLMIRNENKGEALLMIKYPNRQSNALQMHQKGYKLYEEWKLKEMEGRIEEALKMFEEAARSLGNAAKYCALDILFDTLLKIINTYMENGAYEEAEHSIAIARINFHNRSHIFNTLVQMINDNSWDPNYLQQYYIPENHRLCER